MGLEWISELLDEAYLMARLSCAMAAATTSLSERKAMSASRRAKPFLCRTVSMKSRSDRSSGATYCNAKPLRSNAASMKVRSPRVSVETYSRTLSSSCTNSRTLSRSTIAPGITNVLAKLLLRTAKPMSSGSPRKCSEACASANGFCRSAPSTRPRSARKRGDANSSAAPSCSTAMQTMSRSSRRDAAANSSAKPLEPTAAITTRCSDFNSSAKLFKSNPSC
mmetsp:Transcript_37423/g.120524  ORF Transcript_37423/g.120524 Transcript_37423/m.120524 type:complete len:222 (-) Transcript_37423:3173-3838(-)